MEEELCLVDSCTTNYILNETKYFHTLNWRSRNVLIIAGCNAMIVFSGRATITFPSGTQVIIEDGLLYPNSTHVTPRVTFSLITVIRGLIFHQVVWLIKF
jgi:hypothetical protein